MSEPSKMSSDAEYKMLLYEFEKVAKDIKQYLDKYNIDIPITCEDPRYKKYDKMLRERKAKQQNLIK